MYPAPPGILATSVRPGAFRDCGTSRMTYRWAADAGNFTPTQVSLAKRNNVDIVSGTTRETRQLPGGNGMLAEFGAMRHMANLESVYTYEGTHDVHSLILGQAITGLNAFKGAVPGGPVIAFSDEVT